MKFSLKSLVNTVMILGLMVASTFASAAALTDYAENKINDALLRGQSLGAPATFYVALCTATPTDTGCGTEVSGGSYARVAVTSSLANWSGTQSAGSTVASTGTDGTSENNAAITYAAPTANWGVVTGFCLMDALTAGNAWVCSALTTNKTINNGDAAPSFAISALTFTSDN